MRSRGFCAGAARVRLDVRDSSAGAHRAAGGLHRGPDFPSPQRDPREGTLTLAFARCVPMARAAAERASVPGATVHITKTTFRGDAMARSRGGRRMPPSDLLTDLTADAPEAAARPATAKTLDAAAQSNAEVLPKVEVLRKCAFAWSQFIVIAVIAFIVLDPAVRFGLLQRLTAFP